VGEIARSSKWCPVQRLGATTEEPNAMDWVFSRSQRTASWEKPGSISYCRRWNFDPTSGHRLCSTHFTRDCFERDPLKMMELGVDGTFKRRLKPDATPNVPLASPDPEKKKWRNSSCSTPTHSQGSTTEASKGRGMWFLTLQHYTCAKASREDR
jgi:hypothetical protein